MKFMEFILSWRKPTLADLPPDERRRAKALMLGCGAGSGIRPEIGHKKIIIHVEDSKVEK